MFQGSQADVVIIEGCNVVGSGCVKLQFCIQYIQVDAYAAAVTDSCNLVGFFSLRHSRFGGTDLFFIGKDIQVILSDFQFHRLPGLEQLFLGYLDPFFGFLHCCLGGTAIPEVPADFSKECPVIFIDFGKGCGIPAVTAANADGRHIA